MSSKINSVRIRNGSYVDETNVFINVLRHMEYDHLRVHSKLSNVVDNTDLDKEEANVTMYGQLLSNLVDVLSELDLDEAVLGSLLEFKVSC
jgi:hypothetical protein